MCTMFSGVLVIHSGLTHPPSPTPTSLLGQYRHYRDGLLQLYSNEIGILANGLEQGADPRLPIQYWMCSMMWEILIVVQVTFGNVLILQHVSKHITLDHCSLTLYLTLSTNHVSTSSEQTSFRYFRSPLIKNSGRMKFDLLELNHPLSFL